MPPKANKGDKKRKAGEESGEKKQEGQTAPTTEIKSSGEGSGDANPRKNKMARTQRNTVTKVCKKLGLHKKVTTYRLNNKSGGYVAFCEFLRIPINNTRVGIPVVKRTKSKDADKSTTVLMGTFYDWRALLLYLVNKLHSGAMTADDYMVCLDRIAKHFHLNESQQRNRFWNNFMTENVIGYSKSTLDAIAAIPIQQGDLRDSEKVFRVLNEWAIGCELCGELRKMHESNLILKNIYDGESIHNLSLVPITKPKVQKNKMYVVHINNPAPGSAEKFPEGASTLNEAIGHLYGSGEEIQKLDHVAYTLDYLPKEGIWYLSTQQSPATGFIPEGVRNFLKDKYELNLAAVQHPTAAICGDGRSAEILLVPSKKAREQKEKKQALKEKEKQQDAESILEKDLDAAMSEVTQQPTLNSGEPVAIVAV